MPGSRGALTWAPTTTSCERWLTPATLPEKGKPFLLVVATPLRLGSTLICNAAREREKEQVTSPLRYTPPYSGLYGGT